MLYHPLTQIITSNEEYLSVASPVVEEGMGLIVTSEGGQGKVTVPAIAPQATDIFAGFALSFYTLPSSFVFVETYTVPATGPYTLSIARLPVDATKMNVKIAGATGTYGAGAPGAAGAYSANGSMLTFDAADAGKSVVVAYRSTLSTIEAPQYIGQGLVGISPSAVTGTTGVIRSGKVFTNNFDVSQDWSTNPTDIVCGAGGMVTRGTGNGAPIYAYVLQVPQQDTAFLGLYLRNV